MDTSAAPSYGRPDVAQAGLWQAAFWQAIASQRGHLLPWVPVCFGTGVAAYFSVRFEPSLALLSALAMVSVILAGVVALPRQYSGRVLVIVTLLVLLGFQHSAWRALHVAAPVLEYRYYGPIEGRVVRIDRSGSDKTRLTLDQVRLIRMAPEKRPVRVRVSLHSKHESATLRPGDFVGITGHLSPPNGPVEPGAFDFQLKAWFERLGAVGYTRVPVVRTRAPPDAGILVRLGQVRMALAEVIRLRVGGAEGPFAAAILTGDRSHIPRDALSALRASNLAHLLAISGLHMGLLTGVIFASLRLGFATVPRIALRWPVKKIAAIAALSAGFGYLALSGANVATQRAFIMVSVMFIAICLDRRALTLRSVALAACIVLLIRPESLMGPGFQMSFAATTALIAAFACWRQVEVANHVPRWIRPALGVVISSLVAGLATAPYGAAHFNQMAHYGLLANVLSVPVMGLLVMPGALLAGILSAVGLEIVGIWMMQAGLGWILWVAEWVASLDGSVSKIVQPRAGVLPVLTIGGLILCLFNGVGRLGGVAVMAAALVFWPGSPRPPLLISESGALLGLMTGEGRVLNKSRGDGFSARVWLENDGDYADQEQAFERGDLDRNHAELQLSGTRILFDRDKKLTDTDIRQFCDRFDVVLVTNFQGRVPCKGATMRDLQSRGALAVHITQKDQPELVFSNDIRGPRLWTRSDQ